MAKKKQCKTPQKLWEEASSMLVHSVERLFFKLGVVVARSPWKTIIFTWCFVLLSSIGFLRFHIEKNPIKLWVPPESDFYHDTNWFIDHFGTGFRFQKILITADNILEPDVLETIHTITEKVNAIEVKYNETLYTMKDLCYKVPVVNVLNLEQTFGSQKPNRTSADEDGSNDVSDMTLWLDYDFYCSFLKEFPLACLQENFLDIWNTDLNNLTSSEIVNKINSVKVNPKTGHPVDYSKFFGGVQYDNNGKIMSARSVLLVWYSYVNISEADLNHVGNLVGTEEWVSPSLSKWEREFIYLMEALSRNISDVHLYYEAGRSFGDISGEAMFHELGKLFIGIFLMFFYIQFALSRFNWLEIKFTLGSVGLLNIGMAYVSAVSWCSIFGVFFGPVHSSLPFLLMGLGIDDMFVMKACWEQLTPDDHKKSLPNKVGLMLKHAGVSIVITSFTDIVALLIGAITILPSLKSFCIYAAVGVFFIFIYSVTFYVAVFTLDIRRIEANRNGIFYCYKHRNKIMVSNQVSCFQKIFSDFYRKVVFTVPAKVLILLVTVVVTGFSIEGVLRLEQRFDPSWFIPEGTYYRNFLDKYQQYYPHEGDMAMIFMGEMKYNEEFPKILNLAKSLRHETYVKKVDTWIETFHEYMLKNFDKDLRNVSSLTEDEFSKYLSRFLFSPIGGRYQQNFKFSKPLQCGHPVVNITASSMGFKFKRLLNPEEYIPAMNHVKHIVRATEIETGDGYRSVWSKVFANWATDEVISVEVERNIELALLCVMGCTIILITNLQMCFWIFLCVLLTILNVLGCMQRWGMTVDIVCCIGLELAIGLCVDYAAHVGHTFLTISEGTRTERALKTVTSIGTAILLGGGAMLLSLSLLSVSKAYTFQAFFKIFLLVVIFGLFNGLLFLPVVLSLVGPDSYRKPEKEICLEAEELNEKEKQMVNGDVAKCEEMMTVEG